MLVKVLLLGAVGLLLSPESVGEIGLCKQQLSSLQTCSKDQAVLRRYIWTGSQCRRVVICSSHVAISSSFASASECKRSCSPSSKPVQGRRLARHATPTDASVCALPLENLRENCEPAFPEIDHFYFDAQLQECKIFHFLDCQGNNNSFATIEACENLCLPNVTSQPNATSQPPAPEPTYTISSQVFTTVVTSSPGTVYPQPSTTATRPSTPGATVTLQKSTTVQPHPTLVLTTLSTAPPLAIYVEASVMVGLVLVVLIVIAVGLGAAALWRRNKARHTVIMEREEPVVLAYFTVTKGAEGAAATDDSDDKATKLPSISIT